MSKTTIYVIYEMKKGRDEVIELWSGENAADKRVDELLKKYPNSDGFYINPMDLNMGIGENV